MKIQPKRNTGGDAIMTSPPSTETIDVIVPTHGRLDLTMKCIKRLYDNTTVPFNLVVVDDSTDLTPIYFKELQKEVSNLTYIHRDTPYKSGNQFFNEALEHCKSRYVATVMNSVCVEPEWEMVGINLMNSNPDVGVIGFKCLFPNFIIESAGIAMHNFTPVDLGRDLPGHRLSNVSEVLATQWAFAMLRREAVIGNLDEDIFNGFKGWDDIDNCFVLRSKGWRILYCGLGVGIHEPRSTRGNDGIEAYIANRENAEIFYKRWGYWDKFLESRQPTAEEIKRRGAEAILPVSK